MQNKILATIFAVLVIQSNAAYAQEPISVLVARSNGVTAATARSYLPELNAMMVLSGMPERQFQNAGVITGNPNLTVFTPCASSNPNTLINCIKTPLPGVTDLTDLRETYTADIVLVIVPSISALACGSTPTGMFNLDDISPSNSEWGYAAAAVQCAFPAFVASHEVLHLLSIDHDSEGPGGDVDKPVRYNHAMGHTMGEATAGAQPGDCFPLSGCQTVFNYMSDPTEDFPSGNARGSTLHADAARVVSSQSWDSVASYRSVFSAQACGFSFEKCEDGYSQTRASVSWTGHTLTNVDIDIRHAGGPWSDVFEGSPTCPVINTNGLLKEVRALVTDALGLTAECQGTIIDVCGGGEIW